MRGTKIASGLFVITLAVLLTATAVTAEEWSLDQAHTSIYFRIGHANISDVYGRFNEVDGSFTTGDSPSFEMTISAESVDTGNEKRDQHLRSPDFFNVRQFPTIEFTSTDVTETDEGYEVTGDLTLHGVTKPITLTLVKGGQTEFPPGTPRIGFGAEFTIKRSDFGMDNMLNVVGDEVTLLIGVEGVQG